MEIKRIHNGEKCEGIKQQILRDGGLPADNRIQSPKKRCSFIHRANELTSNPTLTFKNKSDVHTGACKSSTLKYLLCNCTFLPHLLYSFLYIFVKNSKIMTI